MDNTTTAKFERWLRILSILPIEPERLSTSEIHEKAGPEVRKRTIQNDLNALSSIFPIVSDLDESSGTGKTGHWSWMADAPPSMFPAPENDAVLVLALLAEHGADLLPPGFHASLRGVFRMAEERLPRLGQRGEWVGRVAMNRPVIRQSIPRQRPVIGPAIQDEIYRAVHAQCVLQIEYGSRHHGSMIEGRVYPIGVDCQPNKLTLVAQFVDREHRRDKYGEEYVQFVIHRIASAKALENEQVPARFKQNFTMARYLEQHQSDLPRPQGQPGDGREIELVARISPVMKRDFVEYPIGREQQIEEVDGGWIRLTTRISWNQNLEWWLLSMVPDLVVESPAELRSLIRQQLDKGLSLY